ncbi:hypothetical protein V8F20_000642 [Naviculisporaceae sp. PSN 640]
MKIWLLFMNIRGMGNTRTGWTEFGAFWQGASQELGKKLATRINLDWGRGEDLCGCQVPRFGCSTRPHNFPINRSRGTACCHTESCWRMISARDGHYRVLFSFIFSPYIFLFSLYSHDGRLFPCFFAHARRTKSYTDTPTLFCFPFFFFSIFSRFLMMI